MNRFLRSRRLRYTLWKAAGGLCQRCGEVLPEDWHADHVVPFVVSGRTNVHEMQALCPSCNLAKGSSVFKLREHQQEVANWCMDPKRGTPDDKKRLTVGVCVGGGKSFLPVIAGHYLKVRGLIDRCLVVVPQCSLEGQGEEAFTDSGLRTYLGHKNDCFQIENCAIGPLRGAFACITTYQAVSSNPQFFADICRGYRTLVVLDEAHHVRKGGEYHRALAPALDAAAFRISMTGTPDRHDGTEVGVFDYVDDRQDPKKRKPVVDISYGISKGREDRVIVPLIFHPHDGRSDYYDRSGQSVFMLSLTDDSKDARDALCAALQSEFAVQLLDRCLSHFLSWRQKWPRSKMLVVSGTRRRAREVQQSLMRNGIGCALAITEDGKSNKDALEAIAKFRNEADGPSVLSVVGMAYEGLDVKQITHITCLTHIRSFPYLMQVFGRAMRYDPLAGPWESQRAFGFVPYDAEMQKFWDYIKQEDPEGILIDDGDWPPPDRKKPRPDDPPTLPPIVPIASSVTDSCVVGMDGIERLSPTEKAKLDAQGCTGDLIEVKRLIELAGGSVDRLPEPPAASEPPSPTLTKRIARLREEIEKAVRETAYLTGEEIRELNTRVFLEFQGGRKRSDLTEPELTKVFRDVNEMRSRARRARAGAMS